MYAARYRSALDVARRVAGEHQALLQRIFAWPSVIYAEEKLPVWLRDSLVNNLALILEDSYWAQARSPLDDWAFPQGLFGLLESPRGCPDLGCIGRDWYGNLPIVFSSLSFSERPCEVLEPTKKMMGKCLSCLALSMTFWRWLCPAITGRYRSTVYVISTLSITSGSAAVTTRFLRSFMSRSRKPTPSL